MCASTSLRCRPEAVPLRGRLSEGDVLKPNGCGINPVTGASCRSLNDDSATPTPKLPATRKRMPPSNSFPFGTVYDVLIVEGSRNTVEVTAVVNVVDDSWAPTLMLTRTFSLP